MWSAFVFTSLAAFSAPPSRVAKGVARDVSPMAMKKGDPLRGRELIDSERCMECHGVDGQGAGHPNGPEGKFAKLAGQHPDYLLKQIRDFRSGARKHDQMAIMARSISDEDVIDIAAHFALQPVMKGEPGPINELGQRLYEQGDAARGVPACVACHGPNGKGLPGLTLMPLVGGQEWRYLDKQLRDWRSGERRNGADAGMNLAARNLSDADIEALASHLAAQ